MIDILNLLEKYPNLNEFIILCRQYSKENKLNPIDKEIVDDVYFEHFLTINMNLNLSDKIKLIQQSYSDCYNNDKFHYSILDSNRNIIIDYDAIDGTCYAKSTETRIINVLDNIGLTTQEKDILIESTNDIYHSKLNNYLKIEKITENINTLLSKFKINQKVIFSLIILIILFFNIPNVPNTSLLISNGLNQPIENLFYSNYTETPINNYTQEIYPIDNYTQPIQNITQINNYNILSYVTSSTYGDIYKGTSPSGETVLIRKILTDNYTQKEIDNMLYLKDVCSEFFTCIKDNFTDGVYTYIIIEYLRDYISLNKIIDIKSNYGNFNTIIGNISSALTTLHYLGMANRNINSSNIIINPTTLDIKIIDFSKGCTNDLECENNLSTSEKLDFYSLGMIIYKIITGEYPSQIYNTYKDKNYILVENYLENVAKYTNTIKIDLSKMLNMGILYNNKEIYTIENNINIDLKYYISDEVNNFIINNYHTARGAEMLSNFDSTLYNKKSFGKEIKIYTNINITKGLDEKYIVFDLINENTPKDNIINKVIIGKNVHYYKNNNILLLQRNLNINEVDITINEDRVIVKTYKIDLIAEIPILTKYSIDALNAYTSPMYKYINSLLRSNIQDYNKLLEDKYKLLNDDIPSITLFNAYDIKIRQTIYDIDKAFDFAPKVKTPFKVYRGTTDRSGNESPYLGLSKGYTSTSLQDDGVLGFIGKTCCLYEMTLDVDVPYLYLFEISRIKGENEILLPRNIITTLIHTKINKNGMKVFEVKVSLNITPRPEIEIYTDEEIAGLNFEFFKTNIRYISYSQKYNKLLPTYELSSLPKYSKDVFNLSFKEFIDEYNNISDLQKYQYFINTINEDNFETFESFDLFKHTCVKLI